jgi:quercetin dioxygenase-like cupin family protein
MMEAISLTALVEEHLAIARTASSGRSAHTVFGGHGHSLRQTLIALAAGHELAEHESPGEATIHVLAGAVRLTTATDSNELSVGHLTAIPGERHGLYAVADCAILLTVAQAL